MTAAGPLDPEKVRAHVAEAERELDVQRAVVEKIDTLAGDERRELYRIESRLVQLRSLLAERGVPLT